MIKLKSQKTVYFRIISICFFIFAFAAFVKRSTSTPTSTDDANAQHSRQTPSSPTKSENGEKSVSLLQSLFPLLHPISGEKHIVTNLILIVGFDHHRVPKLLHDHFLANPKAEFDMIIEIEQLEKHQHIAANEHRSPKLIKFHEIFLGEEMLVGRSPSVIFVYKLHGKHTQVDTEKFFNEKGARVRIQQSSTGFVLYEARSVCPRASSYNTFIDQTAIFDIELPISGAPRNAVHATNNVAEERGKNPQKNPASSSSSAKQFERSTPHDDAIDVAENEHEQNKSPPGFENETKSPKKKTSSEKNADKRRRSRERKQAAKMDAESEAVAQTVN